MQSIKKQNEVLFNEIYKVIIIQKYINNISNTL